MSWLTRAVVALRRTRFWRSVATERLPGGPAGRPASPYRNFLAILHPRRVRVDSLRPSATFGLGVASVVLLVILAVTGVLLLFHYVPGTDPGGGAYASMLELRHAVPYGEFVRGAHRWAAHLLVVVAFLHMCRVFFRGAFKPPRQFNWVVGAVLFFVVLAESYTGYLLPWDQLSYWAVEIGSRLMAAVPWIGESLRRAILGGDDIGRAALVRFYALHVVILPAAILFLLLVHLWRVRQNGGLAHRSENEGAPPVGEPATVPAWPHLVLRETAVALACLAIVLAMALALGAPLGEPADPAHAPRPAKAAWYFLWLQELVSYDYGPLTRVHWPPWDSSGPTLGSEFWGGVLVPTLCAAALLILPYASSRRRGVGLYFARERRAACIAFAIVMAAIIALILVGNFLRGPDWRFVWPF